MAARRIRATLLVALPLALFSPAPALAGPSGHSSLVALPSVLPPTPLPGRMRWTREAASARLQSAAAYRRGLAVVGLAAGIGGRSLAQALRLRPVEWLPGLRLVEVAGAPASLAVLARSADPRIRYVEPLAGAQVAHVRNDPLTYEIDAATGVPYEWQFHAVGADQALNLARGDPSTLVGVVDSGISAVPDLGGKIAETFWDPTVTKSAIDALGHGTFVASIIAARNDDGFGLAGFCGGCRLAIYKAAPLTDVQVAEGIRTLTDAHVRVINLSIVLDGPSQAVIDALDYATAAGVLVVAASGNEGTDSVDFPASYLQPSDGTAGSGLAVGASDRAGSRASFSNGGPGLSLVAPGTFNSNCQSGIIGAIPASAPDFGGAGSCSVILPHVPGGARYAYASGTSFAAPEVAGTAALVWSVKPSLTSVQVASILEQTASRPAGTGWTPGLGWGVLDANTAVESAAGRSSADSIVLADLDVSRPRQPGDAVDATVKARWLDGTPVRLGAALSCRIRAGGSALRPDATLGAGAASCSFRLPAGSGGRLVEGRLTVSAPGGVETSASFRFAVPGRKPG
jgi:subtilisin family serine protease